MWFTFALALGAGAQPLEAARLANIAGALVVQALHLVSFRQLRTCQVPDFHRHDPSGCH